MVDRTFASLIVSTLSVAALALFDERPDLEEIMTWVDMDTLMLLFGMMILVAITAETGFFDYMAVFVFKVVDWLSYYCRKFNEFFVQLLLENERTNLASNLQFELSFYGISTSA